MATSNPKIKFILDNRLTEIDFSANDSMKPTTTVLNYLRSFAGHKGVKEGCAEGDCGACTVVVAGLDGRGGLAYKSLDSCLLFLPAIHGKQLITVENLAIKNGKEIKLHPVQEAMVKKDGSQCGYCTPGVVMSLFALYKNHHNPSKEIVEDALTGNLCRCTGYRPIIDAALDACGFDGSDNFTENEEDVINILEKIAEDKSSIEISNGGQTYLKPFTIAETLRLRKEHPDALIVNGSTDVALLQTKKKIFLPKILDISAVDELNLIVEDHSKIAVGAGTSMEELFQFCQTRLPALANILKVFGSLQIRNLATLGGNVASASPIGDTLPVLLALNTRVRLMAQGRQRELLLSDFITGYRKTNIEADEIIALIIISKPLKNEIVKTYKISKRQDLDISSVSACFRLKLDRLKNVTAIKLIFGGMAATTLSAVKTEDFLIGQKWSRETIEKAMNMLYSEFNPISDARADADSRRIMAKNLLLKFWSETQEPEIETI
jgi:xanthine dehydrogenase small subunit